MSVEKNIAKSHLKAQCKPQILPSSNPHSLFPVTSASTVPNTGDSLELGLRFPPPKVWGNCGPTLRDEVQLNALCLVGLTGCAWQDDPDWGVAHVLAGMIICSSAEKLREPKLLFTLVILASTLLLFLCSSHYLFPIHWLRALCLRAAQLFSIARESSVLSPPQGPCIFSHPGTPVLYFCFGHRSVQPQRRN